jgi:hypothetical protein
VLFLLGAQFVVFLRWIHRRMRERDPAGVHSRFGVETFAEHLPRVAQHGRAAGN